MGTTPLVLEAFSFRLHRMIVLPPMAQRWPAFYCSRSVRVVQRYFRIPARICVDREEEKWAGRQNKDFA
jgi:hypothetical protein